MALELTVDSLDSVDEAVQSLYVEKDGKFVLDVNGVPDTKGLKSALDKERQAAKNAIAAQKALEEKYVGIDPDRVRSLMAKFENDEEAKLIAAGDIDKVVELRSEKLRIDMQRQVEEALVGKDSADGRSKKFEQKVLDSHILSAASKAGIHTSAIDDALFRGRNMFSLTDDGEPVQLGADGKPIYGKDGKTLFGPAEWLASSKEWAPHWHPAGGSGSGSGDGDGGAGDSRKTIKRSEFLALDPAGQKKAIVVDKMTVVD